MMTPVDNSTHFKANHFVFFLFFFLFSIGLIVSCHKGAKSDQQQHGHFLLHDNQFRNRDLTIFDSPALDGECFLQVIWYLGSGCIDSSFWTKERGFFSVCFVTLINRDQKSGRPSTLSLDLVSAVYSKVCVTRCH